MSFNQLFADEPQPEIAGSAVMLGDVHVGAGTILAQGPVVRAHGAAVSIGNHSAILENGVVIGTAEHPVSAPSSVTAPRGRNSAQGPTVIGVLGDCAGLSRKRTGHKSARY